MKTKYNFKVIQEKKISLKEQEDKQDMTKLCFRSFNYIGSKMKLLDFIKESIFDYTGKSSYKEIQSFADICSGTGVVTFDVIKGGCKNVLINDIQHYAYMVSSIWSKHNIDIKQLRLIVETTNKELSLMNENDLSNATDSYFIYQNYIVPGLNWITDTKISLTTKIYND